MDWGWHMSLALLGAQLLVAALALAARCLPLSTRFARRLHRRRVLLLGLGLLAALWPMLYLTQHLNFYYAKYLGASVAAAFAQVALYVWEDTRRISRGPSPQR